MGMKSGQILILVLLIVVVSLAVGLSVASRNLTNLRISTQTEESQRAFSAAEGGVEDVLSRLNSIADHISTGSGSSGCVVTGLEADCDSVVGDISADVHVKARNVYTTPVVKLGDVAQVNLDGYQGTVEVEWPSSPFVALELTLVSLSGSNYTQTRYAYQPPTGAPQGHDPTNWTNSTCSDTCSASIDIALGSKILRIKPFHSDVVDLTVTGSPDLPTQIYEINSVAKTDLGITRRVQVTRTALPALPAVFDYVLYSEGDIVK
ncbi:hypothetical protein HY405_01315 [Candidatus Microgenomates bacterium]|nr:hypothetical protein [Candidatus Microgenomates bacterium]